jgi:hypothetical protein
VRHPAAVLVLATGLALTPLGATADDLTLAVPEALRDSGLWSYLLPRFTLKTRVRVALGADGALAIRADGDGTPVFTAGDVTYTMSDPGSDAARRFADWLTSDVGRRTIDSFAPAQGPGFTAVDAAARRQAAVSYDGNAARGEDLSLDLCGRCHVVSPANRMKGIGSTPSFKLLRALPDWPQRFEAFFALKPHGAFTQVEGVTPPFPINRPSPIEPVEMTLDELDAILAYVSQLEPADLGAPIQHQ